MSDCSRIVGKKIRNMITSHLEEIGKLKKEMKKYDESLNNLQSELRRVMDIVF
jgi:hypothetical protein